MTRKSRMLTANEVAERLNTTPDTVREWARTDKIPHATLPNGRYRFPERVVTEIENEAERELVTSQ